MSKPTAAQPRISERRRLRNRAPKHRSRPEPPSNTATMAKVSTFKPETARPESEAVAGLVATAAVSPPDVPDDAVATPAEVVAPPDVPDDAVAIPQSVFDGGVSANARSDGVHSAQRPTKVRPISTTMRSTNAAVGGLFFTECVVPFIPVKPRRTRHLELWAALL